MKLKYMFEMKQTIFSKGKKAEFEGWEEGDN